MNISEYQKSKSYFFLIKFRKYLKTSFLYFKIIYSFYRLKFFETTFSYKTASPLMDVPDGIVVDIHFDVF
jgi:hypothetical protein